MARRNHWDDGGTEHESTPSTTRRNLIAATLTGLGGLRTTGTAMPQRGSSRDRRVAGATRTWMTADVPETPLGAISLPGTHHSAMYNGGPDWWYCQNNDLYTQLSDGIRYLDIRPGAYDNWGTTEFWHHHAGPRSQPHKWGVDLGAEAFPDIRRFFDAIDDRGGREFVLMRVMEFWDSRIFHDDAFEGWHYEELQTLLEETLGPYLLDLSEYTPAALLETTPADFDGPKIAICYRGGARRPSWAGDWDVYTNNQGLGHEPGRVLANAIEFTHDEEPTFNRVPFQVSAGDAENIIRGWLGIESNFGDLYEGAERTNALLPGYIDAVKQDPALRPNVISVDYYELSNVVEYCRDLSKNELYPEPVEELLPLDPATYRLESVDTGYVADVDGEAKGADVRTATWRDEPTQRFEFIRNDDHSYRIESPHSGLVLDVEGAGTDNGDNIHGWSWHGGANQRWFVVDVDTDPGEYVLVNKESGKLFDASAGDEGSPIHQWHMHNRNNQRWHVTALEDIPADDPATDPPGDQGGGGPGFGLGLVGTGVGLATLVRRLRHREAPATTRSPDSE